MGNSNHGLAGHKVQQLFLDRCLSFRVEGARRLVED